MQMLSKSLALIGFQACGKTTLGRLLAQHMKCSFVDTDQLIEQFHPTMSCRDIFQIFGATYFRNLESLAIASLKPRPAIVLATGGGCLLQTDNGKKLKEYSLLIYLKTSAEILKKRIWQRETLPAYLNSEDPHQAFIHLYQERIAIYEKWADYIIEMDGLDIESALLRLITIAKSI